MLYALLLISVVLLMWGILIYFRKSVWDTVHRNLLDLEDHFEGNVIRRSFLSRPYFFGKIDGIPLMVNFSSQKSMEKRFSYVTISYGIQIDQILTISSGEWLEKQEAGNLEQFLKVNLGNGKEILLKSEDGQVPGIISDETFKEFMINHSDLAYMYINKSGILYEFYTDQLALETEFSRLGERLRFLQYLGKGLK